MTADEITFMTSNGRDLEAARQECRNYLASLNPADLDRAWILYTNVCISQCSQLLFQAKLILSQVYRRLERIPPQPLLNLEQVSPYLLRVRDLILAVPGAFALVKFASVSHKVYRNLPRRSIGPYDQEGVAATHCPHQIQQEATSYRNHWQRWSGLRVLAQR